MGAGWTTALREQTQPHFAAEGRTAIRPKLCKIHLQDNAPVLIGKAHMRSDRFTYLLSLLNYLPRYLLNYLGTGRT